MPVRPWSDSGESAPPFATCSPNGVANPMNFASVSVGSFGIPEPRYTHRLPGSAVGSFTLPRHGVFGESDSGSFRYVTFNPKDVSPGYWGLNDTTPSDSCCGPPDGTAMLASHVPDSCVFAFRTHPVRPPTTVQISLAPPPPDPGGPVAPVAPVGPALPLPAPVGPVGPFAPFSPAPVAPVGPVGPPLPLPAPVGPVGP